MDNTQPESANPVSSYQPEVTTPNQKKVGPIVAVLVIVLVLIAAAIYLFATRDTTPESVNNDTASTQEVQPVTNESDEMSDLEADLDTSVSGLDEQNF
jgi:hypothetical protein